MSRPAGATPDFRRDLPLRPVFECQLTQADLARCQFRLSETIDHREDQVLFVDLGAIARISASEQTRLH
jgi:hypothetical protein